MFPECPITILGLDGIGRRLAELVHAFPMRVTYYSLSRNPDAPAFCEQTDVLGVYVPLRAETMGLVGEKMTRALIQKPRAITVSTAREKVIDEPVLISALDDGHSCSCAPI
ncbi:hypothetical protein HYPSUDRAFT_202452 [Hypholoma sublateritium FD-334 SS-4]|uniref:D-isomer specific 2-hydroxyacid dehydrogenase NAD-binding domain-containing protein n=1 Tax=Hypholoma sublateritium (strain FD-334 SS-4) TaxID=945553 RepID=A0A0D2PPX1_HYPSF|nr:hypothetical protein HYPSUDRAFT_202452 [Hypholoma sublateritium FD-334 SS-4]